MAAAGGAMDVADAALACLMAGVNTPVCPTGGGPGLAAGVDMFLVLMLICRMMEVRRWSISKPTMMSTW
jgi:hypothetical protein